MADSGETGETQVPVEEAAESTETVAETLAGNESPEEQHPGEQDQEEWLLDEGVFAEAGTSPEQPTSAPDTQTPPEAEKMPEPEMAEERLVVSFDEDIDPEIKEVFLEEFEEELAHINEIYPTWRANPEDNTETLSEIRRIFHTLKGSGRLVGCQAVGDFGWRVENMCNQVLDGTTEVDERFLTVLDAAKDIMPGLLEALKDNKAVPETYFLVLESAEQVADGAEEVALLRTQGDAETESAQSELSSGDSPARYGRRHGHQL